MFICGRFPILLAFVWGPVKIYGRLVLLFLLLLLLSYIRIRELSQVVSTLLSLLPSCRLDI